MESSNNIELSWLEYHSLSEKEWRKDYFCPETGGFVVTHWKRIEEANKSNQERKKFAKEHQICLINAMNGRKIKHLPDKKDTGEGSYDILCDGIKADLKKTKSATNVVKYASRATKIQGAEIILFEFETWNSEFRNLVDELIRKGYHGYYYISGERNSHRY